MPIALITGATAGIGEAFTRLLAAKKFDLVLVARDEARLNERANSLATTYNISVEVIRADLSKVSDCEIVENRLRDHANPIEVLINNAGFGINKAFTTSELSDESALLDVLVRAPMRAMHAVLPVMKSRGSGTIINVSSVAGWIAGGTYSAAKSYLTVLTESLHTELRGTGIKISALCPGFTRTEFHQRGQMKMTGLPKFLWLSADRVVADAWFAATTGKVICVPGKQYAILSFISRFGPRPLVRKLGMKVRVRQRKTK
jgi:short-subunit dehydrogenase